MFEALQTSKTTDINRYDYLSCSCQSRVRLVSDYGKHRTRHRFRRSNPGAVEHTERGPGSWWRRLSEVWVDALVFTVTVRALRPDDLWTHPLTAPGLNGSDVTFEIVTFRNRWIFWIMTEIWSSFNKSRLTFLTRFHIKHDKHVIQCRLTKFNPIQKVIKTLEL